MARASARPGVAAGGSGVRGSRRRRLAAYFAGVWDELRKVVWPTRPELWRMTWVVVATVVVMGLVIGGADALFATVTNPIYTHAATNTSTNNNSTTVPVTSATPSATPSASASASPSASASASASASPSASPSS